MYYSRQATGGRAALAQIIKEEVKREIMDELRAQQGYCPAPGSRRLEREAVSRRKLAEEIGRVIKMREAPGGAEEYFSGNMEGKLPDEPETVFYERDRSNGWIWDLAEEQGRGILYGVGTVVLLGLLMPSYGQKIKTIFTRTALEGAELIEKARSIVARAREDIEDLVAETSLKELMKGSRH